MVIGAMGADYFRAFSSRVMTSAGAAPTARQRRMKTSIVGTFLPDSSIETYSRDTAPLVSLVAAWLRPGSYAEASLGPPVYAILAATTIGMIVSCFRWLIIDHIHYATGLRPAAWDDSRLADRLGAFNYLVESHYRYY